MNMVAPKRIIFCSYCFLGVDAFAFAFTSTSSLSIKRRLAQLPSSTRRTGTVTSTSTSTSTSTGPPPLNAFPIPSLELIDASTCSSCTESCMAAINSNLHNIPFLDLGGISADAITTGATTSATTITTTTTTTSSVLSTQPSFLLNHGEVESSTTSTAGGGSILSNPSFWAVNIMVSIVGLLYVWEESIHYLRKNIPKALEPVIDSMLAEVGGIGFIGLFLEIFITNDESHGLGGLLCNLSERFLGEEMILVEAFEFLHSVFFEVGVAFFFVSGIVVNAVLRRINELSKISQMTLDTDGDGEVSIDELADALKVRSVLVDADGDGQLSEREITDALRRTERRGFFDELNLTVKQRASETLLIRERLLTQQNLPETFSVEKYFEQIFARNLKEMVELSPLTWLPLIPLIALLNAIDLSNEVVSATSLNAFVSSGKFISSPSFFYPSIAAAALSLGWGVFNFWKLKAIKNMLLPTLVRDKNGNKATFLPPRYKDKKLRRLFNSSPGIIKQIEQFCGGTKGKNNHERLFGAAGGNGPEIYGKSIKFQIWLCVAQIIFLFDEIVVRDWKALVDYNNGFISGDSIGNVDMLVPEIGFYSVIVGLACVQLVLAPTTFFLYSTATSIEEMTAEWAITEATKQIEEENEEKDEAASLEFVESR